MKNQPLRISKGQVVATVTPRGPVLNLIPVMDRIMVTDPDADEPEPNMIGGLHLPGTTTLSQFNAYAKVKVLAVGPDVKSVKEGDEVIVVRAPVQKVAFDGNLYFWTNESGVMGICRP